MKNFIVVLVVLFCQVLLYAQAKPIRELSPAVQLHLKDWSARPFSYFVQGDRTLLQDMEKQEQLSVVGEVQGYVLLRSTGAVLNELIRLEGLTYVSISTDRGTPLNDRMLVNNNILPIHQGIMPLSNALLGKGVIMGIIDTGMELLHPDFLTDDSLRTRVIDLWDHTTEFDPAHIPEPYGFGTRWSQAEIDNGLTNHTEQAQWFGHGSTVTGTACGDGSAIGNYGGVAKQSDMAIVSFDFERPDFLADVVQSMQYLFDVGDAHGKPVVANMSLGTYYGSHDGLDPASLYIDSLLDAQPGRIAVAAVGNSNGIGPYHLKATVDGGTAFTWFESEANLGVGGPGVFFELWGDIEDLVNLQFSMGADRVVGPYDRRGLSEPIAYTDALGQIISRDILNDSADVMATVQYWAQERGEQAQMQVFISAPDSSLGYLYPLIATGTGIYDVWSTSAYRTSDMRSTMLPSEAEFPLIVDYVAPTKEGQMVSSFTCSDHVVTVGNHTNRVEYPNVEGEITMTSGTVGEIASTSSAGPTRDGRIKPDLTATGSVTLSPGNFPLIAAFIDAEPFKVAEGGMHIRNGGSSMAAPVVAGLAALYLEQCPQSTWSQFKTDLLNSLAVDDFTGLVPNPYYGNGKLNGYATVAASTPTTSIEAQGAMLIAGEGESYEWYLEGEVIEGETGPQVIVDSQGYYEVEVTDERGCVARAGYDSITGLDETLLDAVSVIYDAQSDRLIFKGPCEGVLLELLDSRGALVERVAISSQRDLDVSHLSPGIYSTRITKDRRARAELLYIQ